MYAETLVSIEFLSTRGEITQRLLGDRDRVRIYKAITSMTEEELVASVGSMLGYMLIEYEKFCDDNARRRPSYEMSYNQVRDMLWSKYLQICPQSEGLLTLISDCPIIIIGQLNDYNPRGEFVNNKGEQFEWCMARFVDVQLLLSPLGITVDQLHSLVLPNSNQCNDSMRLGSSYLIFVGYDDGVFYGKRSCKFLVEDEFVHDRDSILGFGDKFPLSQLQKQLRVLLGPDTDE